MIICSTKHKDTLFQTASHMAQASSGSGGFIKDFGQVM